MVEEVDTEVTRTDISPVVKHKQLNEALGVQLEARKIFQPVWEDMKEKYGGQLQYIAIFPIQHLITCWSFF